MILLRFLFIAIVIIYIIRMAARLLLPMLFQSVVNKAQENAQQQYRSQKKPEGKVSVDYIPEKKKSSIPDSEGDFIDYEDIK